MPQRWRWRRHVVFREKGPVATRELFTGTQRVVNFWLLHHGFSIGIGDTIADQGPMTDGLHYPNHC